MLTLAKCLEITCARLENCGSDSGSFVLDIAVRGVSSDSRRCKKGELFFCKGSTFWPSYALSAEKNGACAIVISEKRLEEWRVIENRRVFEKQGALKDQNEFKDQSALEARMTCGEWTGLTEEVKVPILVLENEEAVLKGMALCSAAAYGEAMKRTVCVAVTGTKGKSTVCKMIKEGLCEEGIKAAILTEYLPCDAPRLTTPEAHDLHRAAEEALKDGVTHLVVEVSSQAQKLYRTYGISFEVACFTNLGCDHIGPLEHTDMEDYYKCKASLFGNARLAVINVGDAYGERLYGELGEKTLKTGFSGTVGKGDIYPEKLHIGAYGCDLSVRYRWKRTAFPLVCEGGAYNAQNALCAASACIMLGVSEGAIMRGIYKARVGGRGEEIKSKDGNVSITVDYAHNEMSFEAVIGNAKKRFTGATVTVVFGCPGDKAQCRRRGLARVCAKLADRVVFCEDDGGDEGYDSIANEMRGHFFDEIGAQKGALTALAVSFVKDRAEALAYALSLASERGGRHAILLLGKGDEDRNRICGCDEACEKDAEIAKRAIAEYDALLGASRALEGEVLQKCGRVLAVIDGEGAVGALCGGLKKTLEGGAAIIAVCTAKTAKRVEEVAFSQGVAFSRHALFDDTALVDSEIKMGILPIFAIAGAMDDALKRLVSRYFPHKVVYLTEKTEIIEGVERLCVRLSNAAAKAVFENFKVSYAAEAKIAFENGAMEFAAVSGSEEGALLSYLCGGRIRGAIIEG